LTKDRKPRFSGGYAMVAAAFCIQTVGWGIFVTLGVFFNPLLIEFGWTRVTISGAASLCLLIMGLFSPIAGKLNDRFGPRMTMTVCGFFLGSGCLLMSQVDTIWQLYLFYGVIVGIGISAVDVSLLSAVARWFISRKAVMSGIIKVGAAVGMLTMPPLANWLITSYGWRTSYLILGVIALVLVIPAAQFLRSGPSQMQELPNGNEKANSGCLDSADGGFSLWEATRTRQFWIICAIYSLALFGTRTTTVHIIPHAVDLGISATNAANVLAAIGGTSIAGRLIMGSTGDRVGNKPAAIICFLTLAVAFLWLALAGKLWMLYLFACVYGFAHGGFFTLISPLVADVFGLRSHGVILGIAIFSGTIGGAIGPVLAGHIFDITNSYQQAFFICVALSIVAFTLALFLRPIIDVRRKV